MPKTYPVPLTIQQAVAIECMLASAALDLDHAAQEHERWSLPRIAAQKRREAVEARTLSVIMRMAIERVTEPA
jgi:hypothetical protein